MFGEVDHGSAFLFAEVGEASVADDGGGPGAEVGSGGEFIGILDEVDVGVLEDVV